MKKIAVILLAILVFLSVVFLFWYHTPTVFLRSIDPADISVIHVGSGHTGNRFDIEDPEDIAYIVASIQAQTFRKGRFMKFVVGFWYTLSFCDANGNKVSGFTVNSDLDIRSGNFAYHPDSSMNVTDYLQALEETAISGK